MSGRRLVPTHAGYLPRSSSTESLSSCRPRPFSRTFLSICSFDGRRQPGRKSSRPQRVGRGSSAAAARLRSVHRSVATGVTSRSAEAGAILKSQRGTEWESTQVPRASRGGRDAIPPAAGGHHLRTRTCGGCARSCGSSTSPTRFGEVPPATSSIATRWFEQSMAGAGYENSHEGGTREWRVVLYRRSASGR
jgi:hypothetical protein